MRLLRMLRLNTSTIMSWLVLGAASMFVCLNVRGQGVPLTNTPAAVDLTAGPNYSYSTNIADLPLFSASYYGLKPGMADYEAFQAVAGFAKEVATNFPAGIETFVSYFANPAFTMQSPFSGVDLGAEIVGSSFNSYAGPSLVFPGRNVAISLGASGPAEFRIGGANYEVSEISSVSPLVLDFDGDGALGASGGIWQPHPARMTGPYAAFDIDGDGFKDICEWIGPGDALLTSVEEPVDGRDLFGTANGWRDGYERLSTVYDTDGNGVIEGDELANLCAWRDFNGNGIADPGEVALLTELGITSLSATPSAGISSFRDAKGNHKVWDWWPNVALVNRRSATNAGSGRLNASVAASLRAVVYGTNLKTAPLSGISTNSVITVAQLAKAGINMDSFRLAQVVNHGRMVVGFDRSSGAPARARLAVLRLDASGQLIGTSIIPTPFESLYQIAVDPVGAMAMVLGNHGSRLVFVDLGAGTILPSNPILLSPRGMRASGLAGYSGAFWFSAWQLDATGAVVDEKIWALTPFGFDAGLSLDALRTVGAFRMAQFTGPDRGFMSVASPGGDQLFSLTGGQIAGVELSGSVGAISSLPDRPDLVEFSVRGHSGANGPEYYYNVESVPLSRPPDGCGAGLHFDALAAGSPWNKTSLFVVYAQIPQDFRTVNYYLIPGGDCYFGYPFLSAYPGQARICSGAFAHYSRDGITLVPLPDSPTPPPTVVSYSLQDGSEIVKGCALCGIATPPTPVGGSFDLRVIETNSFFTSYRIENLVLESIGTNGTQYQATGSGYYQVSAGGAEDFAMSLAIVRDGVSETGLLTNYDAAIQRPLPNFQVGSIQTNVVSGQQYRLQLVASPTLPSFTIRSDAGGANLRLDWKLAGSQFQVEWASAVQGPYAPLGPVTTNRSFVIGDGLTNAASFYRIRAVGD